MSMHEWHEWRQEALRLRAANVELAHNNSIMMAALVKLREDHEAWDSVTARVDSTLKRLIHKSEAPPTETVIGKEMLQTGSEVPLRKAMYQQTNPTCQEVQAQMAASAAFIETLDESSPTESERQRNREFAHAIITKSLREQVKELERWISSYRHAAMIMRDSNAGHRNFDKLEKEYLSRPEAQQLGSRENPEKEV